MRFHQLLHLVEGAYLDLAHALAGDVVLSGEFVEGHRTVRQPAGLEDPSLPVAEDLEAALPLAPARARFPKLDISSATDFRCRRI